MMSLTPSSMVPLGSSAAGFNLPDVVSGQHVSLDDINKSRGVLVMFICNHCPYVKHVQSQIIELSNDYLNKEIGVVAISSNDIDAYPEDSPEAMRDEARKWQYSFPYLYDESQKVARAYRATCTPDFYLFNGLLELVYRGQLDDSRPGNSIPVDGASLRNAMDDLILGNPVDNNQMPSVGCNIKWK